MPPEQRNHAPASFSCVSSIDTYVWTSPEGASHVGTVQPLPLSTGTAVSPGSEAPVRLPSTSPMGTVAPEQAVAATASARTKVGTSEAEDEARGVVFIDRVSNT